MARPRDRPSPQQRQPAQRGRGPDGLRLQVRRGAAPTQGTSRPGRPGSRATERLISQGESEAVEERQLGLGRIRKRQGGGGGPIRVAEAVREAAAMEQG